MWPEQASWLLYYLIPKAGGGERPRGMMASLVRVWERLRKPDMLAWMHTQKRSYDWAIVGRLSEAAVWEQRLHMEGMELQRDDDATIASATFLFNMVTCFERVRL